ncbi:sulfotransferase family protein [Halomonas colorata]|uniref:Sulfotransferase family 2 domain-containing protein n=1 Tax=Halomonas colorata TaxID=2742615 RepID=A0ABR9G0K7_9GAMM|nr:sulfotransferase family protein [Halomonas colorata]MBE0464405.1 sulfotransferase family 2 domain-containing protein [Halomonas colorata]
MSILDLMLAKKSYKELDLNTHISLKNKYVFFQVSKVASSTVKDFLQNMEVKGTSRRVIDVNNRYVSPHIWPSQLNESDFLSIIDDDSFNKISFVRNPYARILSCYLHRIVKDVSSPSNKWLSKYTGGLCGPNISFSDFAQVISEQESIQQESHWRRQSDEIFYNIIKNWCFIGRFESLSQDLNKVQLIINGNNTSSQESKLSGKDNFSPMTTKASSKLNEYYDDKTQELIYNSYLSDFKNFGYSKEL